jgi:hypothetical protein
MREWRRRRLRERRIRGLAARKRFRGHADTFYADLDAADVVSLYTCHYPGPSIALIELNGKPIFSLYVVDRRRFSEFHREHWLGYGSGEDWALNEENVQKVYSEPKRSLRQRIFGCGFMALPIWLRGRQAAPWLATGGWRPDIAHAVSLARVLLFVQSSSRARRAGRAFSRRGHVRAAGYRRCVAEEPDRAALLTALTTEHFGLSGARAQVSGESSSRAALYISSVSSTLVALGFIGQISTVGDTFNVFALTVLPTLYVLGLFTFIRVTENGVEDLMLARATNRIRNYYLEIAGEEGRYFMLTGHDDALGVMRNMGVALERRQQFFTTGSMIAVINSVVGGGAVAIAVGAFAGAPLGVCAVAGGVAAIVSLVWLMRIENRMFHEMGGFTEVLFPSPETAAELGDGGE